MDLLKYNHLFSFAFFFLTSWNKNRYVPIENESLGHIYLWLFCVVFLMALIWWICTRLSKCFILFPVGETATSFYGKVSVTQTNVSRSSLCLNDQFTVVSWESFLPKNQLRAKHRPQESHAGSVMVPCLILWGRHSPAINRSLSSSVYWQLH